MTNRFTWKKNLKFLVLKNNRENQIFFLKRILQRILQAKGRKYLLQTKGCQ